MLPLFSLAPLKISFSFITSKAAFALSALISSCGKKILFEVKLNIELERDLISQLNQYVYADYVILADGRNQKEYDFKKNYMFVIDMYSVYKYITAERRIIKIFDLDDLKDAVDICKQMKKAVCD